MTETDTTESKKERILQAAIKEFGEKGYINASTNAITNQAGVSKGLLFHYFKDKPSLHLACVYHVMAAFRAVVDFEKVRQEKDLLKRLVLWMEEKKNFLDYDRNMNYVIIDLMTLPAIDKVQEAKAAFQQFYDEMEQFLKQDVDISFLREDVDPAIALEYIFASFETFVMILGRKYGNMQNIIKKFDTVRAEAGILLELLKHGVYR